MSPEYKYEGDGSSVDSGKPLSGVKFVLKNSDGKYLHQDETTRAITWVDNLAGATEAVRRHRMEEQVLVKTGPREDVLDWMEQNAPDINYMAILREKDEFTPIARRRKINYVGVEALFATEDVPIASPEYVRSMNRQGMLVWINTIVYNYKAVLAAGHSDDTAVSGDPDTGWGWLLKQGYNIIQTDFPQMLRQYMEAFRGNGRG